MNPPPVSPPSIELPGTPPLTLRVVPCLEDNFAYLLSFPDGETWAVDVPEAEPLLRALDANSLRLTRVLITHTHHDHVAGLEALARAVSFEVVGPAPPGGQVLGGGEILDFRGASARVLDTSGHSACDLSFLFPVQGVCFCGDTVFAGGCGRIFAGPPARMWHSLKRLRDLPDDTRLCCGHDYAAENYAFAVKTFPGIPVFAERQALVRKLAAENLSLMPTTVGEESRANPMWMADHPDIAAALGMAGAEPESVFTRIRELRNLF